MILLLLMQKQFGNTPLAIAVNNNRLNLVEHFIHAKCDIDIRNKVTYVRYYLLTITFIISI